MLKRLMIVVVLGFVLSILAITPRIDRNPAGWVDVRAASNFSR